MMTILPSALSRLTHGNPSASPPRSQERSRFPQMLLTMTTGLRMKLTMMMMSTGTRNMTTTMAMIMNFLTAAKTTTTRKKMGYLVMVRRMKRTRRGKKHQVKRKMVCTTHSHITFGIKTVILPDMLSTSTWQTRRLLTQRLLRAKHLQTKKTQKKRLIARAQSTMLMTIQGEDVDDVEVRDVGVEGPADTQLQAVRCRIRPKLSLSNNNSHNSNTNRADAQLELLTLCHLIHNSNSNRTSINSRNHLKTLSSSLFSSVGLTLILSSEPCQCTMTDMGHHLVNVVDVDSRGAVVLDKDNNSVGLHLLNNSNLLL